MAINISKHIEYWRTGAEEDWEVAEQLIVSGKSRHGLFFAHLAMEKVLKGHYCRQREDIPPYIHSLTRLAELAELPLSANQMDLLDHMNVFNLSGRYPEREVAVNFAQAASMEFFSQVREIFQWLMNSLDR